jgi:hypothetical protein
MIQQLLADNVSALLAHLPKSGLLLLLSPLLCLIAIKIWQSMRTGASKKAPAHWILSGEYDEQGLPLLARETAASPEARYRAAMAAHRARQSR